MTIQGSCDQRFHSVRQEFERNFRERGEVGASVCVTLRGQTVVNLWGGTARPDAGAPWEGDTVSVVFSSTKGTIGFAGPKAEMSFGYTMNKMGTGVGLTERGQSLIDSVYRALGYHSNASGRWA
jgi:beta-lactamase family protein